jgi:ElaB/YqjD/DUF883 family membrane-anchored ribosome-binding protein
MENRVSDTYLAKSIMSDWNELLTDEDFVEYIVDSLNIRTYEKKTRVVDGKREKGAQMFAIKKAIESGKDKNGAIYFLMRAVHFWRMAYLTQIKHKPEEYKNGKVIASNQHSFIMNELQTELEELHDILEGRGVISEKEYNEVKEDLNDKIYELEKENKKLKSSIDKEKESIEEYHKKLAQTECARLQKKISWLEDEIRKISATKNTTGQ